MATVGTNSFTMIDWAKTLDPDGQPARIINLLSQRNEILTDMISLEGNLPTGHQSTQLTGLPAAAFRLLNAGVPESKDTNIQVTDTCGMLEAWSKVDQDLAMLNGNTAAYRLGRAKTFLEAMNQTMATNIFYGNTSISPEKFLGFAPRYALLSAGNGGNIIDALGNEAAGNMSVWLITWDELTAHAIFPKGSQVGLIHEDLGLDTVLDASGNPYRAYRDRYQWKIGLSVPDWRYHVRIANIDVSNLVSESSQADLIKLMIIAMGKIPNQGMGKSAFYMNRTAFTMMHIQALAKSSAVALVQTAANQFELSFMGIPIRKVDALLNTEARVV